MSTQKSSDHKKKPQRRVHEAKETAMPSYEDLYFDSLHVNCLESSVSPDATQAFVELKVGTSAHQETLQCKVDTSAEGNILPYDSYSHITSKLQQPPRILPSEIRIIAYGGTTVKQHGICTLGVRHKDAHVTTDFYVTDTKGPVLIGLPTCRALGLVSLNFHLKTDETLKSELTDSTPRPTGDPQARAKILSEFNDVFQGIGCLEGTYKINIDSSAQPVVHPPRRIPINLHDQLKCELDSLVDQGIISPVTYPTDWVNSCVCVTKNNGSIRLCIDPRDLNRAVKRPHYVTPTLEDVLSRLAWREMVQHSRCQVGLLEPSPR